MKQTQTKLFDFSDVGLDFCAGSKNLFPDRFKKMLSLGYNEQTVSSVAVTGNQVVLTYGVSHGYVADRVLKITSGALAAINNGEFWIDSVTANTVTLTIDGAPISVAGGFVTKIASLGWQLVYEVSNIHVYKFKALDESDFYLRLCYQNNASYRNSVAPCVGDSFDQATGAITDSSALTETSMIQTPNVFAWEFTNAANNTFNNYTYSQGLSVFGRALITGSKYHLILNYNGSSDNRQARIVGVIPCSTIVDTQKVVLMGESRGNQASSSSTPSYLVQTNELAYVGKYAVVLTPSQASVNFDTPNQAANSFYDSDILGFNTTSAEPVMIYHRANGQLIGAALGVFRLKYATLNAPAIGGANSPFLTKDIDLDSNILVHYLSANSQSTGNQVFYAIPVEPIKYA